MDSAILARYKQHGVRLIPGFEMNVPVMDRTMPGDIGLELEMEGHLLPLAEEIAARAPKSGAYWTTHQDGSLRGESTEYVLSVPCFEDEVSDLVSILWAAFKAKGTTLNLSNRCSTHCHVNIQGLKISDLVSILALWSVFEKQVIEKFGGESRTTNHFCLSLRDSDENIGRLGNFLRTGMMPGGRDLRYSALNIASIWTRGSVEFRCAPAAETPKVPILFGLFMKKFVQFAVENFHNPAVLGASLSERGAVDLFQAVCATRPELEEFYRIVVPQGEEHVFNHDGLEGFRIAQPLCHVFPWYDWMPMIDKKIIDPFGTNSKKKGAKVRIDEGAGLDRYLMDLEQAVNDNGGRAAPAPAPRRGGLRPDAERLMEYQRVAAAAAAGLLPHPEPGELRWNRPPEPIELQQGEARPLEAFGEERDMDDIDRMLADIDE